MGIVNNNGKGTLMINYLFKNDDMCEQIHEEMELKNEIAKLLSEKGYKFVIVDGDFIDNK